MTDAMISWIFRQAPARRAGSFLLSLAGVMAFGASGRADDLLPKATPVSKYAKMAARSPFAPPTAPVALQAAPTPPPTPGWADNLTATMVTKDGNALLVTVVDAQNAQQHLYLSSEPDKDATMFVSSIKWDANSQDPPVITLRKGREFAQVRYDPGSSAPGTPNGLGGGPLNPGALRNPPSGAPAIPGAPGFHAPLLNPASGGNSVPASSLIRRPLIRSQPAPAVAPAAVRPGVNPPNAGVRPNPAVQVDDDDDD